MKPGIWLVSGIVLLMAGMTKSALADCGGGRYEECADPYCFSSTCPMTREHCCRDFGNIGALNDAPAPKIRTTMRETVWKGDWK